MASTNVTIRMDSEIKQEAEKLFNELGLNLSSAVNIFVRRAIAEQGIPFDVRRVYSDETIQAMMESDRIGRDTTRKRYDSFSEILEEIDKDDE